MINYLKTMVALLSFIKDLLFNLSKLNDNIENNNLICKNISNDLIKISKIKLQVLNLDNVPKDKNVLIAANHQSFFDVFILISALERTIPFAAAKELYKYPVLGKFIASINCIPIDRYTEDITKLKSQINQIYQHLLTNSLIIFPEGECSYEKNEIREFKKGGFMKINQTDALIIPTYIDIKNYNYIGRWFMPTGDITVNFGNAFRAQDISDKKVSAKELANYTEEQVLQLKRDLS